jgi:hypothetical protein
MKSRGGWRGRPNRRRSHDAGAACVEFIQVLALDQVIALFERLERIYREHKGLDTAMPVVPDRECGTTGITGGLTETQLAQ